MTRVKRNSDGIPQSVGHFKVLTKIGEGGMGTVYEGLDETLNRKVALKLIRDEHRLDPSRKARFLREAKILAQLDHPNIGKLIDFFEDEDADCLILELVEGQNLRQALESGIDRDSVIRVIAQLVDVLVAVHGQGLIHRDLKPENLILTTDGALKVLDFGLAREITAGPDEPGVGESDATETGDRPSGLGHVTSLGTIMGTVGYMSPEQARGEPATAASDIYTLGLLMQELLTGRKPLDPDLPREIRLQRAMWGQTEDVEGLPQDLTQLIERLKSLQPAARPAAVDVAAMLGRIRDRPRRRRRQLAVASVIVLLSFFGGGMTLQYLRAERERLRAEHEAATATQIAEFLQGVFATADPYESRGETVTARDLLDGASERILSDLPDQPAIQGRLLTTMGTAYFELGNYEQATTMLQEAIQRQRELFEGDHDDLATSLEALAVVFRNAGDLDAAQPVAEEALAMRRRLAIGADPKLAVCMINSGNLLFSLADYSGAADLYREAVAVLHEVYPEGHEDLATGIGNLSAILWSLDEYDESEELAREALTMRRQLFPGDHPDVATGLNALAALRLRRNDPEEAERLYRESLEMRRRLYDGDHPLVAGSLNNLAGLLKDRGNLADAEAMFREALAMRRRLLGDRHPDVAQTLNNLALLLDRLGEESEAEALQRESLAIRREAYGDDHPKVARSLNNLAAHIQNNGQLDEAEAMLREGLRIRRTTYGEVSRSVAGSLISLASVLQDQGAVTQSEEALRQALSIKRELLDPDHPEIAEILRRLGSVLHDAGDPQAAEDAYREALEVFEAGVPPTDERLVRTRHALAELLREEGHDDEATRLEGDHSLASD